MKWLSPIPMEEWHGQLLDMAAQRAEAPGGTTVRVTPEVHQAWTEYAYDLRQALGDWLAQEQLDPDKLDEMYDADAEYNVYMTLAGHGVGIWDGRWDHILDDEQIEDLTQHLESRIGRHVDSTGGGRLEEAMDNAVYQALPNPRGRNALKRRLLR